MLVAICVPFKRWPRGSFTHSLDTAVSKRIARYGVRVSPADLADAIASGQFDVRCDSCQYSYRQQLAYVRKVTKRRRVA